MITAKHLFIGSTVLLALAGCFEPPDLKLHEPGKYVGKPDSLVTRSTAPEHARRLQERFANVQTDR